MWEDKLALRMKKADAFLTLLALNFPETQEVIYLVASCRSDADGESPAKLPARTAVWVPALLLRSPVFPVQFAQTKTRPCFIHIQQQAGQ